MWKDAILITLSCTLFVQMGLSEAVQQATRLRLRVLSCPKCCSFWVCLAYLTLTGHRIVDAVAASFLLSYISLWLALGYDALAQIYNNLYGKLSFSEASRAPEDVSAHSGEGDDDTPAAGGDELHEV